MRVSFCEAIESSTNLDQRTLEEDQFDGDTWQTSRAKNLFEKIQCSFSDSVAGDELARYGD
jgi:hypothetical protein